MSRAVSRMNYTTITLNPTLHPSFTQKKFVSDRICVSDPTLSPLPPRRDVLGDSQRITF